MVRDARDQGVPAGRSMNGTIVDLTDRVTLNEMAKRAGVTLAQARALAAMFADLNVRDAIRIISTCQLARIRESERAASKR